MTLHSTLSIALILLIGATVPTIAKEGPNQTFTCTAKTFNECLGSVQNLSHIWSGDGFGLRDLRLIERPHVHVALG
jgi:hypothetical protein